MMSEHVSTYDPAVLDASPSIPALSPLLTRVGVFMLAGLAMGLVWAFAAACYQTIAGLEGIYDQRAGQVTGFYGYWMAALWVTGSAATIVIGRREAPRGASFADAVRGSRSLRQFSAAVSGLVVATLVIGVALVGLASLASMVVTPPAAWLIMTLAGALGAIWAVTRSA